MGKWKIGKYRLIDVINPKNWVAIIDSKLSQRYVNPAYIEQAAIRLSMEPCASACLTRGACRDCQCKLPDAMLARNKQCSEGHWGPMLNPKDWNKFKEETGLKIVVKYG